MIMKKLTIPFLLIAFIATGCNSESKQTGQGSEIAEPAEKAEMAELPDWQYVGYKIVHHMTAQLRHIDEFGFNNFEHPPIANHTFFG